MHLTGSTDIFMHDLPLLPLTAHIKHKWKGSRFYRHSLSNCLGGILVYLKMALNPPRLIPDLLDFRISWMELTLIDLMSSSGSENINYFNKYLVFKILCLKWPLTYSKLHQNLFHIRITGKGSFQMGMSFPLIVPQIPQSNSMLSLITWLEEAVTKEHTSFVLNGIKYTEK